MTADSDLVKRRKRGGRWVYPVSAESGRTGRLMPVFTVRERIAVPALRKANQPESPFQRLFLT
jgi:hypothetical protein